MPLTQPLWGLPMPLTPPRGAGLVDASPAVPGDVIPRSNTGPGDPGITSAAAASTPPLPELEVCLECIPARDEKDTGSESQSRCPPVEHQDIATIAALLTVLPYLVSVWQKVKLAAITSGDYKGAELIDASMLGGWEPENRTVAVYPIIRGNRTTPDTLFQWPVLSELHQLVAKHDLGSTAVANML
ncbi:hypothetical protein HGM15179_019410 [Zosterops borbonicus]|uniref:Uncharacterized protein n=1 Tax=Zosterops borbonicus TaxID=364589 RepID=A0A8K1DAZ2_9PASS|nr:hypothetical protein HGM15179_019410 [Zosterops borbonicus]